MLVYFLASFPKVAINARGDEITWVICSALANRMDVVDMQNHCV